MKFKIHYVKEIEAPSRQEAIDKFFAINKGFDINADISVEPLCPKNKEKGICYEQCGFRENGMCDLDYKF